MLGNNQSIATQALSLHYIARYILKQTEMEHLKKGWQSRSRILQLLELHIWLAALVM